MTAPADLADPAEKLETATAMIAAAHNGAVTAARDNPGATPAAYTIRFAATANPFVTLRLIDGIYSWTFDADESLHMSRRREVMVGILTEEIAAALRRGVK